MKQYTQTEFIRIVKRNGFLYKRHSGDHAIYINSYALKVQESTEVTKYSV